MGKYCNFGCGTVTCNYDGQNKFRTTIGDYCFIGCNTNWWPPSRWGTAPTPPPAAPSPRTSPPGPWPSPGTARPTWEDWAVPKMEAYIQKKTALEQTQRAAEAAADAAQTK